MFNLDKFISESITFRQMSMFNTKEKNNKQLGIRLYLAFSTENHKLQLSRK